MEQKMTTQGLSPTASDPPLAAKNHPLFSNLFLFSLVSFVLGFCLAVFLQSFFPKFWTSYQKGYDSGYVEAKKVAEAAIFISPAEVKILSGNIKDIEGDTITLFTPSGNPFNDKTLDVRTVQITASTSINKLVAKSGQVYKAEVEAYQKERAQSSATSAAEPLPFVKRSITIADLKVGDPVNVIAQENIKDRQFFTAQEIEVQVIQAASLSSQR